MSKLYIIGILVVALSGAGLWGYRTYVKREEAKEALIRKDERTDVVQDINAKTEVKIQENKKVAQSHRAALNNKKPEVDKTIELKKAEAAKAQTEIELNAVFKGALECIEKRC